jgi:hypothetical protein
VFLKSSTLYHVFLSTLVLSLFCSRAEWFPNHGRVGFVHFRLSRRLGFAFSLEALISRKLSRVMSGIIMSREMTVTDTKLKALDHVVALSMSRESLVSHHVFSSAVEAGGEIKVRC